MELRASLYILFMAVLAPAAAFGEQIYLQNNVTIDCGEYLEDNNDQNDDEQVRTIDEDTAYSVYMQAGQKLWIGANILAEYQPSSAVYSKELVETYLMCGHDTDPTADPGNYSKVRSRSGVNHWIIQGQGSRLATMHYTKAIYTAEEDGFHACWVIYACSAKSGDNVTFKKDESFMTVYPVDTYPGINWIPQGDELVNSTAIHTPGGSQLWNAGTLTQNDTEVVVYWSPRLTNCESGDSQCGSSFEGYDADTYFDWRIVVYQYQGDTVCNKDFGPWNEQVLCKHHDHHCDRLTYHETSPIVTGTGSEGSCGGSDASRKFKVYTQIRKSFDPYTSDIMVHNSSTGRSNVMIYSR